MKSSSISVPVSTALFLDLTKFLSEISSQKDPVDVVEEAISYWMDNASWKGDDMRGFPFEEEEKVGYMWKSIFLPEKTQIEVRHKGKVYSAIVREQSPYYEGKPTTPAQLVNAVSGTSLNAWLYVWIKRPEDKAWILADDLRKGKNLTLRDLGLL